SGRGRAGVAQGKGYCAEYEQHDEHGSGPETCCYFRCCCEHGYEITQTLQCLAFDTGADLLTAPSRGRESAPGVTATSPHALPHQQLQPETPPCVVTPVAEC